MITLGGFFLIILGTVVIGLVGVFVYYRVIKKGR
jgi:hypothetical protein